MLEETKFNMGLTAAIPPKSGLSSTLNSGIVTHRSGVFQTDEFHRLTEAIEQEHMTTESPTIR